MSIVCATHLSASSAAAVTVAAHLAQRTHERLILATVLTGHGLDAVALADGLDQERARLSALGLEVELALLHGKFERAIERRCRDAGARLLVVGDRSSAPLRATPAERLAWSSSVPLLVVRGDEPLRSWTRGERALRVLLGSGAPGLAPAVLGWLTWLASAGPLEVLATRVLEPAADHEAGDERELQRLRAALLAMPLQVGTRAHVEVTPGGLGEVLSGLAAREPTDLLLVGTQPATGLFSRRASLAHELLRHASTSVALVPLLEARSVEALPRTSPTSPRFMRQLSRHGPEH